MKKLLAVLLVLVMTLSCFSACKAPETTEAPAEKTTEAPADKTTEAPAPQIKTGGIIHVYTDMEPKSLDAFRTRLMVTMPAYEGVLIKKSDGTFKCNLIKDYKADIQNLTYTLYLKDEPVYFHDDSIMDAEALAWNINQYKECGYFASSFNMIDKAEAVDDKTVVIKMKEWDLLIPYDLSRMCYPVSKEFVEKNGWDALQEQECGTGAFKLKNWVHGDRVEFEKFTKYHEGEPRVDEVHVVVYSTVETALLALQKGEIEIMSVGGQPKKKLEELQNTYGCVLNIGESSGAVLTLGYMCNNPDDPLYDKNVRKALSHAIDCNAIGQALTDGYFVPDIHQWGLPTYAYCSPNVTGFEYDPELAKKMLAEAGYPNGFKTTLKGGTASQDRAVMIKSYLAEIGVEVELEITDRANFDQYVSGWPSGLLLHQAGTANGQEYQLSNSARSDVTTGFGSGSFIHNEELDKLCRECLGSEAKDSYAPMQRVAEIMFQEECCMLPLYMSIGMIMQQGYLKEAHIYDGVVTEGYTWHLMWLDK